MTDTILGAILVLAAVAGIEMLGAHVGQEMAQAVELILPF